MSLYFWVIYEVGFPEGSNMKAPGDLEFPFGALIPWGVVVVKLVVS